MVAEGWHPGDTLRGSLRGLVAMLKWLGDTAIFAVIVLLPAAIVVFFAAWALRRLWRLLRRRPGPTAERP